MTVTCRWCGEQITLNADSPEFRQSKTDPMQQIKQHCSECQKINLILHGFECAFVTHMLAFDSATEPERWRRNIANVVDYTLKQPAGSAEISIQPIRQAKVTPMSLEPEGSSYDNYQAAPPDLKPQAAVAVPVVPNESYRRQDEHQTPAEKWKRETDAWDGTLPEQQTAQPPARIELAVTFTNSEVSITCEAEQHALETFQKEGHFVCGLTDENGFRRPWATDEVHVLTLKYKGEQVLRIMADTPQEALRLMQAELRRTLFALWLGQKGTAFNFAGYTALNDHANQLQAWINAEYSHEIETGKHQAFKSVFDAAVWYLRKERHRLSVKIGRLLRRQKPAQHSDWEPMEWRQ